MSTVFRTFVAVSISFFLGQFSLAKTAPTKSAKAKSETIEAEEIIEAPSASSDIQNATLTSEVEGHLKKDEDAVSYKTVYLEVDSPKLFKSGFHNFAKDCNMRLRADKSGEVVGTVNRGKRLWVDDHSETWAKIYRSNGPAYIYKGCL